MENSTILQVLQFVGYAVIATVFIVMIKADVKVIKIQIEGVIKNLDILNSLLSKVAVQDVRISGIEEDVRELKHGRGFVDVHGEYTSKVG